MHVITPVFVLIISLFACCLSLPDLDPTRIPGRQTTFNRTSAAPIKAEDQTLWTETPAEVRFSLAPTFHFNLFSFPSRFLEKSGPLRRNDPIGTHGLIQFSVISFPIQTLLSPSFCSLVLFFFFVSHSVKIDFAMKSLANVNGRRSDILPGAEEDPRMTPRQMRSDGGRNGTRSSKRRSMRIT